ncbi:hypothetical protein [Chakrabartyella piscis]|uniref:hypothetical protein n=1 Tax=Chakrabartyella piscis TaxID=2918914 RepID=UPI0029583623|nr:hypothetical protein [Chakrabartyella piscis]
MITIFNRRELWRTYSMDEQAKIRDTLAVNGIDYTIKVMDKFSRSPIFDGGRDMIDIMTGSQCQYVIYVRKVDYDQAIYWIQKR